MFFLSLNLLMQILKQRFLSSVRYTISIKGKIIEWELQEVRNLISSFYLFNLEDKQEAAVFVKRLSANLPCYIILQIVVEVLLRISKCFSKYDFFIFCFLFSLIFVSVRVSLRAPHLIRLVNSPDPKIVSIKKTTNMD